MNETNSALGFIGLGHMGSAIARRLLKRGLLEVFDKRAAASAALSEAGATVAASAADLARASDVVFCCLPESRDVEELLFGEAGIAQDMRPGAVLVDMTTGDPAVSRRLASRMESTGLHFADAPVSGGPMGAAEGRLSIMVGARDDVFARIGPILETISPNVARIGAVGTGHAMKLANNVLNAVCRLATAEAVALAAKNGVDPNVAVAALQKGSGRNYTTEITFPRDVLPGTLKQGFTMGLMHKDVRTALALAEAGGVPTPFAALAESVYRAAAEKYGPNADVNRTVEDIEAAAGIRLSGGQ